MSRTSKYALPDTKHHCSHWRVCIYRDDLGFCDEPRTNRGNYDAACHGTNPSDLLRYLKPLEKAS